jgi:putative transposase
MEYLVLRHQIGVLTGALGDRRPRFGNWDRALWVVLAQRWVGWRHALAIVQPATVVGWHREGFRRSWARRSRAGRGGRPALDRELVGLVRKMSRTNVTQGAPRIRNELAKLGIEIAVSTVARHMVRERKPSSPSWRAFLDNHVKDLVAVDFFTVPTATFGVLFGSLVLAHDRRRVLHFNVTANPSAEWTARQVVRAFPEERGYGGEVSLAERVRGEAHRLAAPRVPGPRRRPRRDPSPPDPCELLRAP